MVDKTELGKIVEFIHRTDLGAKSRYFASPTCELLDSLVTLAWTFNWNVDEAVAFYQEHFRDNEEDMNDFENNREKIPVDVSEHPYDHESFLRFAGTSISADERVKIGDPTSPPHHEALLKLRSLFESDDAEYKMNSSLETPPEP